MGCRSVQLPTVELTTTILVQILRSWPRTAIEQLMILSRKRLHFMVDGQPTSFQVMSMTNLLRAEGISGNNLNIRMNEIFTQLPSRGGSVEEERAFRERQMDKVLRDVGSIVEANKQE